MAIAVTLINQSVSALSLGHAEPWISLWQSHFHYLKYCVEWMHNLCVKQCRALWCVYAISVNWSYIRYGLTKRVNMTSYYCTNFGFINDSWAAAFPLRITAQGWFVRLHGKVQQRASEDADFGLVSDTFLTYCISSLLFTSLISLLEPTTQCSAGSWGSYCCPCCQDQGMQ